MATEKVLTVFQADTRQMQKATSKMTKDMGKLGTTTKTSGKRMKGSFAGAAVALGGLVLVMKSMIKAANKQENAEKQLNAVLKSTKKIAGLTAKEIKKMASEMQSATTFGDEMIISSSSLLLTFTKIGSDIFPRAQQAILDVSQAMGQDLKTSTIQLGKALNDPIKGLAAMSRVGITFSKSQQEMVKRLQESGDLLGAQKIILKELETQFGGSAKAAAETFGGKMKQLGNVLGDIKENIGSVIIDAIKPLITVIAAAAKWFSGLSGPVKKVVITLGLLVAIALVVRKIMIMIGIATNVTAGKFILWTLAIAAVIAIGVLLAKNWTQVTAIMKNSANIIFQAHKVAFLGIKLVVVTVFAFIVKALGLMLRGVLKGIKLLITAYNKLPLVPSINTSALDSLGASVADVESKIMSFAGTTVAQMGNAKNAIVTSAKIIKTNTADIFGKGIKQAKVFAKTAKNLLKTGSAPKASGASGGGGKASGESSQALFAKQLAELTTFEEQKLAIKNAFMQGNQLMNQTAVDGQNEFNATIRETDLAVLTEHLGAKETLEIISLRNRLIREKKFSQANLLLTKAMNKAKEKANKLSLDTVLQGTKGFFSNMITIMGEEGAKQFAIVKALNIANAVIDGISAAIGSYKAGARIGGPPLGAVFAGASVAATGIMVSKLASQQAPKAEFGGIIPASQSGTLITAGEKGKQEAIIPLEGEGADRLQDSIGGGGGSVTLNFNAEVFADSDFPEQLAQRIDRALNDLRDNKNSAFA